MQFFNNYRPTVLLLIAGPQSGSFLAVPWHTPPYYATLSGHDVEVAGCEDGRKKFMQNNQTITCYIMFAKPIRAQPLRPASSHKAAHQAAEAAEAV